MAQTELKGKTILGLQPFSEKLNSNPPIPWEKWRSQLKMAIVAKTNIQVEDLLREKPTSVIYSPEPAEEPPVNNPTQTMERERLTRYHQAITKWKKCNVINRVGVLFGDKPWDMADRKAKSLKYLSLGVEGSKMHGRKFPHTNVETKTTQEIWEELEITFIRPRNVTFDQYLLLTRRQQRGEAMKPFHSALCSLAEHCQRGHLEDELLRDIFTANMINPEIQKELLKVTLSPERALKVAIGIELGARNQLTIQSKNALAPMDKPENVMVISSSRFRGTGRPPRTNTPAIKRQTSHNCRNCGQPWTIDHRSKCQAIGQTCRRCNKPNHFATVCKSNLNRPTNTQRVNEIENNNLDAITENVNNISIDNEVQSQYTNSEDDYTVNMLSPEKDKTTPAKLEIQYGNSKYWVMVDSGSSASLVMERMAKEIEERDRNTWWSHTTNPVQLRSYTNDPIYNKGTLYSDLKCNGWNAWRADLIVVPNRHRAIIGRDPLPSIRNHSTTTGPQESGR